MSPEAAILPVFVEIFTDIFFSRPLIKIDHSAVPQQPSLAACRRRFSVETPLPLLLPKAQAKARLVKGTRCFTKTSSTTLTLNVRQALLLLLSRFAVYCASFTAPIYTKRLFKLFMAVCLWGLKSISLFHPLGLSALVSLFICHTHSQQKLCCLCYFQRHRSKQGW